MTHDQFTPRFEHDCPVCQFLGHYKDADLYFCATRGSGETVVARFSSEGSDYACGIEFTGSNDHLGMALRRAMELGLVERKA